MSELRDSRFSPIPSRLMFARERRLDGEAYLTDGFQYRHRIECLANTRLVGDLARVWQPSRLKGIRVRPQAGLPFLAATQAFDIHPRPRKWLARAHVSEIDTRYVADGTILVTRSGNVGDPVIAYEAHRGLLISDDLLRVEAKEAGLNGYLYAYFRTRHCKALMRSSQYGNVIKHLEPEHLDRVPVPVFEDALVRDVASDVDEVFRLRTMAHTLSIKSERLYAESLSEPQADESSLAGFSVRASGLWKGRRRLEAYSHNPVALAARTIVEPSSESASAVTARVFGVPRFKHVYTTNHDAIPYLDSEDLFKLNPEPTKFIPLTAKKDADRYFVKRGWLLMACSGQLYGFNGRLAIADESHEQSIVSNHVLRLVPQKIRSGYLYVALGHPTLGRPLVLSRAFGTSVPEIDASDITELPVARLGESVENEIADAAEAANELRMKAKRKENGAVERLEKRIDDALAIEGVEGGPVKVNLPFDEAIRRALQVAPPDDGWADERSRRRKGGRKR